MEERISHAVRECLAECNDWDHPLPALAAYVARLLEQGWESAAAHEVGREALRILDPQNPVLKNGEGKSSA